MSSTVPPPSPPCHSRRSAVANQEPHSLVDLSRPQTTISLSDPPSSSLTPSDDGRMSTSLNRSSSSIGLAPRQQSSHTQSTSYPYGGNRSTTSLSQHRSTASGRKSRATSSMWGSDGYQIICAVSEARGVSPSVGLAFVNVTTNEAVLSQICDSQFYVKTVHKIQVYAPSTVLVVRIRQYGYGGTEPT
jgi:DNA mismatch repair protein MSH4